MVQLINHGIYLIDGKYVVSSDLSCEEQLKEELIKRNIPLSEALPESARKKTIAWQILSRHNTNNSDNFLKIKFDALASHDITYVGIIQTARASGLFKFPLPYVLTNCHNSLCAVGGTINEDDHFFGLSAAQKYGGIFVPAHLAVIHQYMREMMTGCGRMILGSDSHTRYGALGTMGVGEGGPELVKQLLGKTYDIEAPKVIAVYLEGKPAYGVGPQDIALAIIAAVFKNGFVKNKVMEFVGPGVSELSVDFRNGIDVMTTESTCLSSIWCTDDKVLEYYKTHNRGDDYKKLEPGRIAYYDAMVRVDLSKVQPMIALPFHPSNAYPITEVNKNAGDFLAEIEAEARRQFGSGLEYKLHDKIENGRIKVDQGVIAGCAGGMFENICYAADVLEGKSIGHQGFSLSVYPSSQPVYLELIRQGIMEKLMTAGAIIRSAFCGPCFGAGDIPCNNGFSIRHTTRNFPNREGSKPGDGQVSYVALMDARSITATAANGGLLTAATELVVNERKHIYSFNKKVYDNRVYNGFGRPDPGKQLKFGPNIADWPKMIELTDNLLLKVVSVINDPVTTTDELIPSGETSSYRSNPLKLAEFTLSRKDPGYVARAKAVYGLELKRRKAAKNEDHSFDEINSELKEVLSAVQEKLNYSLYDDILKNTGIGSVIYANKPGDGSAREQAASCQKVLGGWANISREYATKRYRSNLINWGIIPFTIENFEEIPFKLDDYIFIPGIKESIESGAETVEAVITGSEGTRNITLNLKNLEKGERDIILSGCLINYYSK
ncbi:MAG TPA: hydratase [Clostridiaceae bacterium]|nr:hydratase [Clostridiaceae bacterium]